MEDVFGNKLKIGSSVLFMQVGYRFFGVGEIISLSPKTCVIEFEGQKVRQFPNQLINTEQILNNKIKLQEIRKILNELDNENLQFNAYDLVQQIKEIVEK